MKETGKQNFAFVSYKREDEKWAKWLQQKLENYKLPAVIRKENADMPKYIRPVFRDKTDLGGGVLPERLRDELLCSKFLIVICSPHATKSDWVNREIQTFIDEGRTEQIVPFIVDGTPHAENLLEECFPKALLDLPPEKELLGINVQELGKNVAIVRLVATLQGLRFDTLWQRHRRRLVQQRIVCGVATLFLLLVSLFVWDYNRATYAYFADYVDCYGVPNGVVLLTDEQAERRHRYFLFEYRRVPFGEPRAYSWRVHQVSYVNSALCPQDIDVIEWMDRYPIMQLEYNEETGAVSRINFCNVKGKVLLRHVLSERNGVPATVADFIASREQQGTGFIGASLSNLSMGGMDSEQNKSNIVRFVYERDENGYIVRQTYHSNNDYQLSRSAVSDADGIFGKQYTLDSLGRRIRVDYLGIKGEKVCTQKGIAGFSNEYEPHGNISKTVFFNLQDSLVLNDLRYAMNVCNVDAQGNIIAGLYYGTSGKLCLNNAGYAKWAAKYDERGNEIEACHFDTKGEPCLREGGYSKSTAKYDGRSNRIEVCFFDTEGKPCLCNVGYAKWTAKYDGRSNRIEVCFFDTEGKPCLCNAGCSKWTTKYDERGNEIEVCYFDTEEKACLCNDGYSKWTAKYDERGNEVEKCFFDAEEKPCMSSMGFAKYTRKLDERGNVIEFCNFDTEGKPCLDIYGVAKWTYKYGDRGNLIEECYFDAKGEPCLCNDGYSKWTAEYDERGNEIERCFFDTEGEPCLRDGGYFKYACRCDEKGNMIEFCYFDTKEKPCLSDYGYTGWKIKYDERGNQIERYFFDTEGKPCLNDNGFAKWTSQYDERRNETETCFFDSEGKPCLNNDGIAIKTTTYDVRNRITEICFYDTDRNPVNAKGYFKETRVYDERGNLKETIYIDKDGKQLSEKEMGNKLS